MSLRGVVVAAACVAALVLVWQKREQLQAWVVSTQAAAAPMTSAAGPLRKCVNGQQVSYTNAACPPGHKEQAVTAAPVNVLPATPVPRPVASSSAPLLHQALDIKQEATLKDKMMERAIDGAR